MDDRQRRRPASRPASSSRARPAVLGLRDRSALGSALALFMYPHSVTAVLSAQEPQHDPPQRRDPAGVLASARPARAARLRRDRGRDVSRRPDGKANAQLVVPQLFEDDVPELVRRRRVRRHRDRRAGAGSDHVDRGGEPVHPQHLQGVHQARTPTRRQEAKVSKIVSLVVKFGRAAVRAARWTSRTRSTSSCSAASGSCRPSRDRGRPLHPVVPPLGAARRLGGRHGLRHGRVVPAEGSEHRGPAGQRQPQTTQSGERHFGSSLAEFPFTDTKVYIALTALLLNLIVAVVITLLMRAANSPSGVDSHRAGRLLRRLRGRPAARRSVPRGREDRRAESHLTTRLSEPGSALALPGSDSSELRVLAVRVAADTSGTPRCRPEAPRRWRNLPPVRRPGPCRGA